MIACASGQRLSVLPFNTGFSLALPVRKPPYVGRPSTNHAATYCSLTSGVDGILGQCWPPVSRPDIPEAPSRFTLANLLDPHQQNCGRNIQVHLSEGRQALCLRRRRYGFSTNRCLMDNRAEGSLGLTLLFLASRLGLHCPFFSPRGPAQPALSSLLRGSDRRIRSRGPRGSRCCLSGSAL